MRKRLAGFLFASAVGLGLGSVGCTPMHASFVKVDSVALGRVVIYRNGVAFYERHATVEDGLLTVSVPRDRVDDFLKSLTVVDARTNQPLGVSIPRERTDDGTNLVMKLELPTHTTAEVVLTYVTESPAWKPSYRVVVGDHHDVMLEGWAIVDNTSGEDWRNVLVGVGSSSALSFRYDLWSVRDIQRETLANEEKFAVAPPTGVSPYAGKPADGPAEVVLGDIGADDLPHIAQRPIAGATASSLDSRIVAQGSSLSDEQLAKLAETESKGEAITINGSAPALSPDPAAARSERFGEPRPKRPPPAPAKLGKRFVPPTTPMTVAEIKLREASRALQQHTNQNIVIENYTNSSDADANQRATARANAVRDRLIDQGIAASRIQVVNKVDASHNEHVRLVAQNAPSAPSAPVADGARGLNGASGPIGKDGKPTGRPIDLETSPVGESHFANRQPMTVEKGSSAMVSMVRSPTDGEIVYLYDAESERGNAKFAFRAVRFKNPTDSTLEAGPVTVYGSERFIGEGLTEPIPPNASAVVPYALDRQLVVERADGEDDHIARLVTLQRGALTAQVQRVRHRKLTVTNRLDQVAKLFVRHTVGKGWTLTESPPAFERIGDAHLFQVQLAPRETKDIVIAEATPIQRTLDLGADSTLEMMKVWLDAPDGAPELKDQLRKLLAVHKTLVDLGQEQDSVRRRLDDYRSRMDELHAQILTLQAVKTGGDLMVHLKAKMKDISDRVQKATIQLVDQEEKIMLAKVQFQDALAELVLPDAMASR